MFRAACATFLGHAAKEEYLSKVHEKKVKEIF
jgi:hypothetical protein